MSAFPVMVTEIRATHPYSFRSERWAKLLSTTHIMSERLCYHVQFTEDDREDFWPVCDNAAGYEFR